MILSSKRITKALISLHGCPGWSAPLLFPNPLRQVLSRRGQYTFCHLQNNRNKLITHFNAHVHTKAQNKFSQSSIYYIYFHVVQAILYHIKNSLMKNCITFLRLFHMDLYVTKPIFGVCKQQRRRPACTSVQSDLHLPYLLNGRYHI